MKAAHPTSHLIVSLFAYQEPERHFLLKGSQVQISQGAVACINSRFNTLSNKTMFNPFLNKPWFSRVCYTSLENTVGKGEIARNKQFLFFPQLLLTFWIIFSHVYQIPNCCLQTLSVWKSLKFVVWERVNSLPHNPDF